MSIIIDLAAWRAAQRRREAEVEMETLLRKFVEDNEPLIDCGALVRTYEVASRRS